MDDHRILIEFSNTLCLQWGYTGTTSSIVTYPITYTTAYNVVGILVSTSASSYDSSQIKSIAASNFTRAGHKYPLYWGSYGII